MRRSVPSVEGFVWISDLPRTRYVVATDGRRAELEHVDDSSPLTRLLLAAAPGQRVSVPAPGGPPWIVVDHFLDRVVVARWPGRLLRAGVVPPRSGRERAADREANLGLVRDVWYTRANAIDVLEELAPHVLFGAEGEAVARIIDAASTLTPQQASALAQARDPRAPDAYDRAWNRWSQRKSEHSAAGVLWDNGSPIGYGFSVLDTKVTDQAVRHGCVNWDADPDDPDEAELILADPWSTAKRALFEAAVAVGYPRCSRDDAEILAAAWHALPTGANLDASPRTTNASRDLGRPG